ncbi:NAD-P-binding protein [Mycena galericulata]|nr:NAD-P-binding protein [Mycena galericulata]
MSLPDFTSTTTAEEVATVFANRIRGKNGTSINGLGFEAARVIAKYANLVIITGYNSERLKLSEEAIKKDNPSANIRTLFVDLASLTAVRKAAVEVNAYSEPLHVLIHNALAGVHLEHKLSADKLELQMAVDHVAPFLLTKLLTAKLLSAATAEFTPRVIFVSSDSHAHGPPIDFARLARPDPATFNAGVGYSWGKQANVLDAIELSRRSKGRINAYSLHPGVIFTNVQQREEAKPVFEGIGMIHPDGTPNLENFEWKTLGQGAATYLAAAFDPRLEAAPGAYLWDCKEANAKMGPHCTEENAAKLWTATEELIGEKFEF